MNAGNSQPATTDWWGSPSEPASAPARDFIQGVESLAIPGFAQVSVLRCTYRAPAYDDTLFGALGIEFPHEVRRSVLKRKAEYLAGRYLAQSLLQQHGVAASIPIGAHRQPVWPTDWVGSISHTNLAAVSCLARAEEVAMLGIDLEPWFCERTTDAVADYLVNTSEARLLQAYGSRARALTLAFSAKESLFKAVYPVVGRYFDFDSVELVALDPTRGVLSLRVVATLSEQVVAGDVFQSRYLVLPDSVLTLVVRPRTTGAL